MTQTTTIDLGHVARDLGLPLEKVARTVDLLDEGNTVPFITRYRKDQTGGLDEEQIRAVQLRIGKSRQLAERKATILKSIEAQGKLTPELTAQIQHANTPKRLEDLYLPFKPKKRSLATIARERGLEPLAVEIYEARPEAADLVARAAMFLSADAELKSVEEVLTGVGHLIAERFSENPELRGRLRRIFQRTGKIVCMKVEQPPAAPREGEGASETGSEGESGIGGEGVVASGEGPLANGQEPIAETIENAVAGQAQETSADVLRTEYSVPGTDGANEASATEPPPSEPAAAAPNSPADETTVQTGDVPAQNPQSGIPDPQSEIPNPPAEDHPAEPVDPSAAESPPLPLSPSPTPEEAASGPEVGAATPADAADAADPAALPAGRLFEPAAPAPAPLAPAALLKKKKKKKKKVIGEHAFKDYYNYSEPLSRVPPHRVLAINRGERAHAIRVKIEADLDAMFREAEEFLIGPNHPHAEFLRNCIRDSLTRLIIPSLEREIRRELTDKAEEHAVDVFVRNLRKLLLQPPTHGRRILAIDPGFKSGSKMVALDEFGNVLGHAMIFVIGKDEERRKKARTRLADMVKQYHVSVIAIGNGTGCRETEQMVADCLAEELKDQDVAYVIVNEAGASIYSTSPLGREELPQFDALQRGAISIGRRLLDPLSEMVKIHPANLGVGLYQHDIKARHLKDSLDAVVESCVNFVGVDVNSASPALLRYVSGMNALTARRVYEYRREKGPFKNREELKQVPGFGEQTFVQAAGFLKVIGGENPLDATWIHPESYDIAGRVLDKIGCDVTDLARSVPAPPKEEPKREFAAELKDSRFEVQSSEKQEPEANAQPPAGVGQAVGGAPFADPAAAERGAAPDKNQLMLFALAGSEEAEQPAGLSVPEAAAVSEVAHALEVAPPRPLAPSPSAESESAVSSEAASDGRGSIAERAASVDVHQLAGELAVGTHLLHDILTSLTRPGLDPRDNLPPPMFRRGIMKLEDLAAGMELSGTVLNVVDFGVFVDIGLSDSGLVHISRLADRFIRDPHEVVGVGDVLKVWVVDVDKSRRRVSLTAIAPGTERPQREQRPPRSQQQRPPRDQRPPRPPRQPQAHGGQAGQGGPPAGGGAPPAGSRPPRHGGGGRRDQRHGGRGAPQQPRTIDRPPTKPKKTKPITKAMEEGREPMRSFSDLMQLFDKKKDQKRDENPPPATS
jgi:uncharacterized protein